MFNVTFNHKRTQAGIDALQATSYLVDDGSTQASTVQPALAQPLPADPATRRNHTQTLHAMSPKIAREARGGDGPLPPKAQRWTRWQSASASQPSDPA